MNLSPHFTLAEFTRSDTALARGIDNSLPDDLLSAATATAEMLERIRELLGVRAGRVCRINVSSGYRCVALNMAIGSSSTSDHVRAMAADWTAPDFGSAFEVARALAPHVSTLGIGQLIYEQPRADRAPWVHTSTRVPDKLVNRIISILPGKTVAGIVEA